MSVEFTCGDPAALAGYLYDECEGAVERAAIEAHIAACGRCAAEIESLRATRVALVSWAPPDAALGFHIASDREQTVLRPAQWWQRPMPAWAQAAAALLIFAAGAGIGMRAGQEAPVPVAAQPVVTPAVAAVSTQDLAALERRLRAEMSQLRPASTVATPARASSDDAVVQRVRALLDESERRQKQELALRVTQVMRDVQAQRIMDLSNIERTFGQMEGFTRPELQDQRNMINYLIRRTGAQRAPE